MTIVETREKKLKAWRETLAVRPQRLGGAFVGARGAWEVKPGRSLARSSNTSAWGREEIKVGDDGTPTAPPRLRKIHDSRWMNRGQGPWRPAIAASEIFETRPQMPLALTLLEGVLITGEQLIRVHGDWTGVERVDAWRSPWLDTGVVNVEGEVFGRMERGVKGMPIWGQEVTRGPDELAEIGRAEKRLGEGVDDSSEDGGKGKDPTGMGKYGVGS